MYVKKEVDKMLKDLGIDKTIQDQELELEDLQKIISEQALEIETLKKQLGIRETMMMTKNKMVSINPNHVLYLFLDRRGVRSEDDEECKWNIVAMFKGGYTAVLEEAKGKTAAQKELENYSLLLLGSIEKY